MGDPWSQLHSVGEDEGVEVIDGDITESDSVRLLSASSHAEDLVAVWVVVEVLVPSGVGHQEGELGGGVKGVVAPVGDGVVAVGLRELHPAVGLASGLLSDPVLELCLAFGGVLLALVVVPAIGVVGASILWIILTELLQAFLDGKWSAGGQCIIKVRARIEVHGCLDLGVRLCKDVRFHLVMLNKEIS